MNSIINVKFDSGELGNILDELKANLSDMPLEVVKLLFDIVNSPSKCGSFKQRVAEGALVITFEPSQLLLDLLTAVRTRYFDSFLVKHSNDSIPPVIGEKNSIETENSKI